MVRRLKVAASTKKLVDRVGDIDEQIKELQGRKRKLLAHYDYNPY